MSVFVRFKVITVCVLLLALLAPGTAERPAFKPLLQRAENALAAKDMEKAIELYEKLANFYPKSSLAWNRLGFAHYKQKNDPRAIFCFRRSLSLGRNEEALHNLILASGRMADGFAREAQFTEAVRTLENLIKAYHRHPQSSVLYYYRGRLEFLRGNPEEGLNWWKKAAKRAPQSNVAKVVAAQSRELNPGTVKLYEAAAAKVKTEPAFNYLLGKRQYNAGQLDAAYKTLMAGMAKSEKADIPFPLLAIQAAKAALATGRTDEAIKILETARTQRPDWASVRTVLWPTYLAAGRETDAEQALQDSHGLDRRPKLAILGPSDTAVRMTSANGSVKLIPPAAISLKPGKITLTTSDGAKEVVRVADSEAVVFKVGEDGSIAEQSRAKIVAAQGAGQLAPPLVLKDRRGRIYRFADTLLKQPMLILFWTAEDPGAKDLFHGLGEMEAQFDDALETVFFHTDPGAQKEAARLYLSQPGTSAQLWGDAEAAAQLGVEEVPALVLIDKSGRITLTRYGTPLELFAEMIPILEGATGVPRKY